MILYDQKIKLKFKKKLQQAFLIFVNLVKFRIKPVSQSFRGFGMFLCCNIYFTFLDVSMANMTFAIW